MPERAQLPEGRTGESPKGNRYSDRTSSNPLAVNQWKSPSPSNCISWHVWKILDLNRRKDYSTNHSEPNVRFVPEFMAPKPCSDDSGTGPMTHESTRVDDVA